MGCGRMGGVADQDDRPAVPRPGNQQHLQGPIHDRAACTERVADGADPAAETVEGVTQAARLLGLRDDRPVGLGRQHEHVELVF